MYDRQVEARREAAHGRRAQDQRREAGLTSLVQVIFAQGLVLGIVGEGLQGHILGDVLILLDTVYTGRGSENEAAHSDVFGDVDEILEAVVVDGSSETRV